MFRCLEFEIVFSVSPALVSWTIPCLPLSPKMLCFFLNFLSFCFPPALLSSPLTNTSLCNLFAGRLSLWFTVSFLNRIMINGLLCSARAVPTLFTQARSSPCTQNREAHLLVFLLHSIPVIAPHQSYNEQNSHCNKLWPFSCHCQQSVEHHTRLVYIWKALYKCCTAYLSLGKGKPVLVHKCFYVGTK